MLRAFSRRAAGALLRPTRDIARLRAFASARVAREGEGEGDATDQQPAAADAMRGEGDEAEERGEDPPSVDETAPVLEFLAAVKVGKAADALVPEHVPDMDALLRVDGITLKKAGLTVKERKRVMIHRDKMVAGFWFPDGRGIYRTAMGPGSSKWKPIKKRRLERLKAKE
ncbi:uncharacterized protein MICPUCDRAFT_60205 [Micromonas pusilla CCMP1545]|mgnify:CR=1 FL=1|uniref:Uncharacterized protein n=2 Tax=Micromonas pusilla TaxID=38833 RepID=C1MXL6_MICPC|nr:uncharacterized protein MICPUCDRAFT_60205 [Micromonas pusilla CCMP1545]EEH55481.1 hypothetical protein MICPUCDRAFT_60205 [Micromonas pusilla CCMP1545]|eukprot:XP_003060712.1 hypothetical protein MICPUCDRAFT_60205 [Micromonas pusilla CCMP1545]